MQTNSVIFENPEEDHLIDLSSLGTMVEENSRVIINQPNHFFVPGDVLAYDLKTQKFVRALAVNTMISEACGVVSRYIDQETFEIAVKGTVTAPQYKYPNGSILYLSEVTPGKLMSIAPTKVFKPVATQISEGVIEVSLELGTRIGSVPQGTNTLGHYTKEELDEIIANIW